MPELRQNLVTKEWVIIASERAKRPNAYAEPEQRPLTEDREEYDINCPFCPGNEELDLEVERFPLEGPWQTRVVRNKFPALSHDEGLPVPVRTNKGIERRIDGVGYHEVIVMHPKHNTTLGLMTAHEVQLVLETFQRRWKKIATDSRIEQIIIFKNHGSRAGASLVHPHSQLIALPVVPGDTRHRIEEMRRYFDDTGRSVVETMLLEELEQEERLVRVSEHFVAFVLYAAASPFHLWVVPRRKRSSFVEASSDELADLADVLRDVLQRMYIGLRDPDYNLIIRSAPVKEQNVPYMHWYVSVVLRLSRRAGFELGSGIYINPSLPEECAAFLREQSVNNQ